MHPNTTFTEPEPTFEESLYKAMKFLHPSLSVRVFSVCMLQRSSGYWSSVIAQQIPLAETALIDLPDYLEAHKIVHSENDAKVRIINDIQQMITDEILQRFRLKHQASMAGWNRISKALREESWPEKHGYAEYEYMPFSVSRY